MDEDVIDNLERSSHSSDEDNLENIPLMDDEPEPVDIEAIKRELEYQIKHRDELIKKNYEPSITYSTTKVKPSIELLAKYVE